MVNFERVEWIVEPDPATAAAALQTGEVDWLEFPVLDLLPMLRKSPGCDVARYDPLGALAIIAFNHLFPPFDNPKLLRALLPAIDQKEYVTAWVGEQQDLGTYPVGFFTGPFADGERRRDRGVHLAARSGEGKAAGRREWLQGREDRDDGAVRSAIPGCAVAGIARSVRQAGTERRLPGDGLGHAGGAAREDGSAVAGRLEVFHTTWGGLATSNPGSSYPLRGNGKKGWFGWPTDPKMEELRDQWFDTPDVAGQKKICEQIQLQAFQAYRSCRSGQWYYPWAIRKDLTDFVKCAAVLFWGVRRV